MQSGFGLWVMLGRIQAIGKAVCGASRTQRLLLAFMRGPASQGDDLETRRN